MLLNTFIIPSSNSKSLEEASTKLLNSISNGVNELEYALEYNSIDINKNKNISLLLKKIFLYLI